MYCNKRTYKLRYTDVDFGDRLKLSSLLSMLEESACASADELGFGYSVLQPRGIGFVIVNWHIELERAVMLGEELTVHTWPVKPKKLIVFRDFEIFAGDEKVGVATSRWCLVKLNGFSVLPSSEVFTDDMTYNEIRSVEVSNWKIPCVVTTSPAYTKTVSYSDYDHYNHVNNTKYTDFLLDAFSPDELDGKFIKSVRITYVNQCKYGETIDFYRGEADGFTVVEGRVGDDTRVQMRIQLK